MNDARRLNSCADGQPSVCDDVTMPLASGMYFFARPGSKYGPMHTVDFDFDLIGDERPGQDLPRAATSHLAPALCQA
jgi:hypothetical protein